MSLKKKHLVKANETIFQKQNRNISSKKEYFESQNYVNGVYNKEGKTLIRPLTTEEQEFLFKFESEFVLADFDYDIRIKKLLKKRKSLLLKISNHPTIIGNEIEVLNRLLTISSSKKEKESIIRRLKFFKEGKYIDGCRDFIATKIFPDEVLDLNSQIEELRKSVNLHKTKQERQQIFQDNNKRNFDLMSKSRNNNSLVYISLNEADRYTSETIKSISSENQVLSFNESASDNDTRNSGNDGSK